MALTSSNPCSGGGTVCILIASVVPTLKFPSALAEASRGAIWGGPFLK